MDEFANKTTAPQILHAFAVRLASDILSRWIRTKSDPLVWSRLVGLSRVNILEANEIVKENGRLRKNNNKNKIIMIQYD